jgi:hypothetical protein
MSGLARACHAADCQAHGWLQRGSIMSNQSKRQSTTLHGLRFKVSLPAASAPTAAQAGVDPITPSSLVFVGCSEEIEDSRIEGVVIFAPVRQSGIVIVEPSSSPATKHRLKRKEQEEELRQPLPSLPCRPIKPRAVRARRSQSTAASVAADGRGSPAIKIHCCPRGFERRLP